MNYNMDICKSLIVNNNTKDIISLEVLELLSIKREKECKEKQI